MIYDGHAYCFEDQRGNLGWGDRNEMMRHRQLAVAAPFHSSWRVRDRTPADISGLFDASQGSGFDALKECSLRAAGFGRWEWTAEGEIYTKQVYPPSIVDMAYPPERLIAEMDYAGVDWALIHRTPYQGVGNEYHGACVMRYPDRLQALAYVEEWLVATEPQESIAKVNRAINELGLHGLQFLPVHLDLYGQSGPWDAPEFLPFWDAVAALGVPVFFSLNPRGTNSRAEVSSPVTADPRFKSYLEELRTLGRWMARYPDVTVVITHGFVWPMFAKEDSIELPDEFYAAAPIDSPNFHVQLLFTISLGSRWDYPMPQMRSCLKQMAQRIGADRLLYGTDMPLSMRYWTYKQTIDSIRNYCPFLSPKELDLILGGNMARIMKIGGMGK